jgi:hypothetical protein
LQAILPERRRPVQELWEGFNQARPRILGALLDAVVAAMRNVPSVKLASLPRMADFARWVIAGEAALGITPGAFIEAYSKNRSAANDLAIEASPIGPPIVSLVEAQAEWKGRATDLLKELFDHHSDDMAHRRLDWPGTPKDLSNKLRRLVPALRHAGVRVAFPGRSKHGASITLERMPETPASPTPHTPKLGSGPVGGVGGVHGVGEKAEGSLDEGVMEV